MPSSGPTNVSVLATTSSSMLVRWGEVPEADRNGLVLGYKVSPRSEHGRGLEPLHPLPCPGALSSRPPGAQDSAFYSGHRGICRRHPLVTMTTKESSLGGEEASHEGLRSLGQLCLPQEATLGAPSLTLSPNGPSFNFHYLLEFVPKLHLPPQPGSQET